MYTESLNAYLNALAGYIHDDDKLVTYKWLSKELEVHVNVAKQILLEFWQKNNTESNIEATIMLMGFLKDGGMRVEVVKESNLSSAKEKFNKIISEHIYSLQKALPDINLLALSGEGDIRYSAIKCDACVERDEEELSLLRFGAASKDHIEADKKEQAKIAKMAETASKLSDVNGNQKPIEEKSSTAKKSPGSQQAGLNNFFGKSVQKQKSPKKEPTKTESQRSPTKPSHSKKVSPSEKKSVSTQKKGPNSGIASFFNKNVQKEDKKKKNSEIMSPENKKPALSECEQATPPENTTTSSPEPQIRTSVQKKQIKEKKSTRGVKRNRSKEEETVKKRKRIVVDEESSDSDPFMSDREEPDLPPSPERISPVRAKSPTPPPVKHEGGKRRVLKIRDKTFQDEDGYLVTQKIHVYESCSEDEAEIMETKPPPKPEPTESKNKKKKQSTLMNFFKK